MCDNVCVVMCCHDGVWKPVHKASGKEYGAPFLGVFFVLFSGTKNTPDPLVRRVVNILNKQHSSDDCF